MLLSQVEDRNYFVWLLQLKTVISPEDRKYLHEVL